jgi:putative transposase
VYIERFWRTLKYEHVYLNPASDGKELYHGINHWLTRYHRRGHQGIKKVAPKNRFFNNLLTP